MTTPHLSAEAKANLPHKQLPPARLAVTFAA
jgi:hypothetical protein